MRIVRPLLSTLLSLACLLAAAGVNAAPPVEGKDYVGLSSPQATEPGKKVEVIEFFAYYCPHCNALDQPLADWAAKQGDNIIFKRVHTSPTGQPMAQQRLFYALQTMGLEDAFHKKILNAIHVQRLRLDENDDILAFMAQQPGVDKQKFSDVYRSFAVQSKVNRAIQMQLDYHASFWPLVVLDGKVATAPTIAGAQLTPYDERQGQVLMLNAMDGLVERLLKERAK